MIRILLEVISGTIFLVWGIFFADDNLKPELYGMSIGIAAALIIETITFLYDQKAFLRLFWDCYKPFQNREIRLTIAYLYKIEIHGHYLLVKSKRINNTYQPVGGVYKYFNPEATSHLNDMGAIPDNSVTNDHVSESDLRLKLINRKNIRMFLRWFFNSTEREWDPWREFYEELVVTGLLPSNEFNYIHYELVGQHFEPIHFDNHFRIDTFKYVDIYTPKFIDDKQKDEIRKLYSTQNTDYIWATESEIMNKVTTDGKRISDHSYKIFHSKKIN